MGPFGKLLALYLKASGKDENDLTARFLADPALISNEELLALLMSYTSDAKKTEQLQTKWKSMGLNFYDILQMNQQELSGILNVRSDTAALFLLIRNAALEDMPRAENTLKDCIDKLQAEIKNTRQGKLCEAVWAVGMDAEEKVRLFERISIGDGSHAKFDAGDLVKRYSTYKLRTVVLMHTHPGSGQAALSEQDRRATDQLAKALASYQITLRYHIVITETEYKAYAREIGSDGTIVYDYIPDIRKSTAQNNP